LLQYGNGNLVAAVHKLFGTATIALGFPIDLKSLNARISALVFVSANPAESYRSIIDKFQRECELLENCLPLDDNIVKASAEFAEAALQTMTGNTQYTSIHQEDVVRLAKYVATRWSSLRMDQYAWPVPIRPPVLKNPMPLWMTWAHKMLQIDFSQDAFFSPSHLFFSLLCPQIYHFHTNIIGLLADSAKSSFYPAFASGQFSLLGSPMFDTHLRSGGSDEKEDMWNYPPLAGAPLNIDGPRVTQLFVPNVGISLWDFLGPRKGNLLSLYSRLEQSRTLGASSAERILQQEYCRPPCTLEEKRAGGELAYLNHEIEFIFSLAVGTTSAGTIGLSLKSLGAKFWAHFDKPERLLGLKTLDVGGPALGGDKGCIALMRTLTRLCKDEKLTCILESVILHEAGLSDACGESVAEFVSSCDSVSLIDMGSNFDMTRFGVGQIISAAAAATKKSPPPQIHWINFGTKLAREEKVYEAFGWLLAVAPKYSSWSSVGQKKNFARTEPIL
jgi:hypothetical protein